MLTIEQLAKEMKPELAEQEARLDIRLSALYKTFLKQVYRPAGYRSLSAFIIQAAIDKAEALIAKRMRLRGTSLAPAGRLQGVQHRKRDQHQQWLILGQPDPQEHPLASIWLEPKYPQCAHLEQQG